MTPLADRLTLVVDACLAGIVLVAPYFMGGRHPVGQLVFVVLAVVMAVAWAMRQWLRSEGYWRFSGVELLLLAGVLLVAVQVAPLPAGALSILSPATGRLLPAETTAASSTLSSWPCISLAPVATRDGLAILLAHGLVLLVTIQRIKTVRDVERLLGLLAAGAVLMALVGLAQYAFGNGRFLWVYEHPRRTTDGVVKGSFINQNHFTHFLALGIGPLVWCIARHVRGTEADRPQKSADDPWARLSMAALAGGLAVVFFAGLSALSRGGAIAMATALTVCVWMFWRSGTISLRFLGIFAGVVALLGATLLFHGYDKVERRLDDLTEGSLERLDNSGGRRRVWGANWAAYCEHPWLGTGVGTHADVYPVYMTEWMPVEYTHAESGYVQIASSLGSAGLILLLATLGYGCRVCVRGAACRREPRLLMCLAALTASLAASAVHSIVDFVWFIPACMSVTMICAAGAVRVWMMSRPAGESRIYLPRMGWGALTLAAMFVGAWLIAGQWGPARASLEWDAYLRDDVALQTMTKLVLGGNSHWSADEIAQSTAQRHVSKFNHLQAVVAANPDDALAHRALAGEYLLRFEQRQQQADNAMSLSQICDAAIASQFHSRQDLDVWLSRAVGENVANLHSALWHARRALILAPLQGENYIFLNQLCFLEGGDSQVRQQYVAQALRVRPLNEAVLIGAAEEAWMRGDKDATLNYFRQAFHLGGRFRSMAIRICAGRFPVTDLILELQPDLSDWPELYSAYRQLNQLDELKILCQHFVRFAEQHQSEFRGVPAARMWAGVGEVNLMLNDSGAAAECARRAAQCAPEDKKTRTFCSQTLSAAGLYEEAEPHIRWCLQRSPGNAMLHALAKNAAEARVLGRDRWAAGAESVKK